MLRHSQPVEGRRVDRFRPKFCPHSNCPDHRPTKRYRCPKDGFYPRKTGPRRRIQRYRCPTCGEGFSMQTFSCTYYLKRPELLRLVAAGLVAGSAHRQIARSLGCAPSTVTRLVPRIGRHSMLLLCRMLQELGGISELIVLDHFESFVQSQLDALGLGTAVGHDSWFVYALDPVDPKLADQTIIDVVNDFQRRGCLEWCFGDLAQRPDYLASGTMPLAGIRRVIERRATRGISAQPSR